MAALFCFIYGITLTEITLYHLLLKIKRNSLFLSSTSLF